MYFCVNTSYKFNNEKPKNHQYYNDYLRDILHPAKKCTGRRI